MVQAHICFSTLYIYSHRFRTPPPIFFTILISLLILLGIKEIYDVVKIKDPDLHHPVFKHYVQISVPLIPYVLHFAPTLVPHYFIMIIIILYCIPLFLQQYTKALDKIARALSCVIFGILISYLVLLRAQADGVALCIVLIFLSILSDGASYVFGEIFGRKKLAPTLSPKKTIEGSVLSLLVTLLVAIFVRYYLLPHFPLWLMLLLALTIGISAQVGDLVFSVFKRDVGIKYYGHLLPGQGGILDRFDSLVTAAPLSYYLLQIVLYTKVF